VEAMAGTIDVESEPDVGTSVRVRLATVTDPDLERWTRGGARDSATRSFT
jgi:hypothetical protein